MLTLILSLSAEEILKEMQKSWESVKDYYSILYSWTRKDNETELKEYEHKFLKPGYVYLKVIKGGSGEACYDPNTGKAKGRKFGITLTLDPEKDKRIQSIRGDKIYDAGILKAIERSKTYKDVQFNGEKTIDNIGVFEISAKIDPNKNYSADKEILYVRKDNYLPYGYIQYKGGIKVKEVYWKNLKLNNGYSAKDVCF